MGLAATVAKESMASATDAVVEVADHRASLGF